MTPSTQTSYAGVESREMRQSTNRLRPWKVLVVLLALVVGWLTIDYFSYHSRSRRVMAVVSELDGRAGSLMGWPFGKEYAIVFSRPLTPGELERASIINTLAGRDYVTVLFKCALTSDELEFAESAFPDCRVREVKPSLE